MKDNTAPEEKLLKLIRAHKKQPAAPMVEHRHPPKETHTALPVRYPRSQRLKKRLRSLSVERLLRLAFVLSCIYLAYSFFYLPFSSSKSSLFKHTSDWHKMGEKAVSSKVRPYSFYLEGVRSKQIFGARSSRDAEGPLAGPDINITSDIKLIGIISGDSAQAIIEDKKQQKTYYLSKGQFLGEFQVEDIRPGEGKIVLSRQGRRYELYL